MKITQLALVVLCLFLAACIHSPEKKDSDGQDKNPDRPPKKIEKQVEKKVEQRVEQKKPAAPVCGDGKIESPEQCEAGLALSHSCQSLGYAGGTLACSNCRFDQSQCVATPKKEWVDPRQWQRRGGRGSCPYVYLFDGKGYRYHTDLSGSVLARGMDFFQPEHYGPNVYKLEGFQAVDGRYRLKAREVIYEASFFDKAELLVVDVPYGYQVYNTWSFTSQLGHAAERRFISVRNPRPPLRAIDDQGRDVLEFLLRADDHPLPVQEDELSRVELDFGPIKHPEHAKLILGAWGHYADLRGKQKPPYEAGTLIETKDEQGKWRARLLSGKAAGDGRSWAVDIGGLLSEHDSRIRITLAHLPSVLDVLDAVRLDDSPPVPLTVHRIKPQRAGLRDEGAASVRAPSLRHSIEAVDDHLPKIPEAMLSGLYTRFGDVLPLLQETDDRFVIMAHGDSLLMEFPEPKSTPGTHRQVFLDADVFYSLKFHPFGQVARDNTPMPFHGMTRYPYDPQDWPYAKDADYANHLKRWQTRKIEAPSKP